MGRAARQVKNVQFLATLTSLSLELIGGVLMDGALDQVADGFVPRGLSPPWYGLIFLPAGLASGFVNVTLGYLLVHHGVGVAAVAGLIALFNLPSTWKFLVGPVLDTSLSPVTWYLINIAFLICAMAGLALTPLSPATMPVLSLIILLLGVATNAGGSSATAAMALTTPNDQRGAVAGWLQVGQLGGLGLGGGLGLWLAQHAGGQIAAAGALAGLCGLASLPILGLRTPPRLAEISTSQRLRDLVRTMWAFVRTRGGALALFINVLPAGLGASMTLMATVSGDWHASADQVALVLGVVSGLATLPGCVLGGYLCDRFARRTVYALAALAAALGEVAMAFGPHTPAAFTVFVVLNAVLVGAAWSSVTAVIFGELGPRAAATVAAVCSSVSNAPVVAVVALLGALQPKHGSTGMLLTEAALGVASVVVYVAVALIWRPTTAPLLEPVAA